MVNNDWHLPGVECFEKDKAFFVCEVKQRPSLFCSVRARLLQQDMFTGCESFHGPFIMKTIRQLKHGKT